MATPGTIISGIGHVGLIGWLIVGWGFQAEPLAIETMDVTLISGEEFEQMRARATPDPGDADPDAPVPPEITDAAPVAPVTEEPVPLAQAPEPVTPPVTEAPLPPTPPQPTPQTPVVDAPPAPPAPPVAPPPTPDLKISEVPTPQQAPTVASTISQPPPDDAQIDDVMRDAVVADETASAEAVVDEQEATAPEQTTTQIVIEDLAPTTSARPTARPTRPQPAAQEQVAQDDTPVTQPAPQEDVAAALEAALAPSEAPAIAAGPPMTGAERDSFRISVNRCWNVDPGSVAARVTVEVGFSLDRDGSVRGNEVRLLSSQGDTSAVDIAFQAARRAILRCQSGGYRLPAEKYDQWEDVVITFDPSGMRLR
ncbi:energy transducer TonB [Yoonia sp.]|uniref:energy transducer TonB n=1 Tax=Yoonia sp. TaxID=2212373 RepID=UPI0023B46AE3